MKKISPYVFPLLKHYKMPSHFYNRTKYLNFTKEELLETIISEFDAPKDLLTSKTRKRTYSEPRKVYCKISVCVMRKTTVDVAKEIPGYDHSVVIHACNTFDDLFESNEFFRTMAYNIFMKLGIPIESIKSK